MSNSGPHRRYNPLLDEWVLCSPQRLDRPWQGLVESSAPAPAASYDPQCYLCPGNTRANGETNPNYTSTFAFDNDFPALVPQSSGPARDDGLFVSTPERGVCRVLCFTPRHDLTLARMRANDVRSVIDLWATESEALAARGGIGYVQLFENKGAMMGCSNPHPHAQIWATEHVPTAPARKQRAQHAYAATHTGDLLGDYLDAELQGGERVVSSNEHWTALVPFWAVWPYQTMLLPRRRVTTLPELSRAERDDLAAMQIGR